MNDAEKSIQKPMSHNSNVFVLMCTAFAASLVRISRSSNLQVLTFGRQ
jgi:hypothetical protein